MSDENLFLPSSDVNIDHLKLHSTFFTSITYMSNLNSMTWIASMINNNSIFDYLIFSKST